MVKGTRKKSRAHIKCSVERLDERPALRPGARQGCCLTASVQRRAAGLSYATRQRKEREREEEKERKGIDIGKEEVVFWEITGSYVLIKLQETAKSLLELKKKGKFSNISGYGIQAAWAHSSCSCSPACGPQLSGWPKASWPSVHISRAPPLGSPVPLLPCPAHVSSPSFCSCIHSG